VISQVTFAFYGKAASAGRMIPKIAVPTAQERMTGASVPAKSERGQSWIEGTAIPSFRSLARTERMGNRVRTGLEFLPSCRSLRLTTRMGQPVLFASLSDSQFFTVIVSESTAFLPVMPSSPASRPR
jgi:hypothetical protein